MQPQQAVVMSSRKNKKNDAGHWIGPNGEDFGPKGRRTRAEVGKADYYKYDTIEEARTNLSDKVCLELINTQVKTNALNAQRTEAVGGVSEKVLQRQAFERLTSSPEGVHKLKAASGDQARWDALIAETVEALKKEQGITSVPVEEEEEEEEAVAAA